MGEGGGEALAARHHFLKFSWEQYIMGCQGSLNVLLPYKTKFRISVNVSSSEAWSQATYRRRKGEVTQMQNKNLCRR